MLPKSLLWPFAMVTVFIGLRIEDGIDFYCQIVVVRAVLSGPQYLAFFMGILR
jgi:hypothetical protein